MADGENKSPKRARNNPKVPRQQVGVEGTRYNSIDYMYVCIVMTYSRVKINRKIANPVHGQLIRSTIGGGAGM